MHDRMLFLIFDLLVSADEPASEFNCDCFQSWASLQQELFELFEDRYQIVRAILF